MNLIFFSFKHRYRRKELNNLLISRVYGKYLLLNLSGPIKNLIAKFLIFFKIGKAISCDGRPVVDDISKGINLWMRGTNLDIPNNLKKLNNNFETIYNPFIPNQKIFNLYPIEIKRKKINDNFKIIHMSRVEINTNDEEEELWVKYKKKFLDDFSLVDNQNFLSEILNKHSEEKKKFELYKKIKLLVRFEIIKSLKQTFDDKVTLYGDDWSEFYKNSMPSEFNTKRISSIYSGNIGLDLGSLAGTTTLYPRSIQIIEAGGLILQNTQHDTRKIWGDLTNKITFNNSADLTNIINKLLNNKNYCNELMEEIFNVFKKSNKSIEKNLEKIFIYYYLYFFSKKLKVCLSFKSKFFEIGDLYLFDNLPSRVLDKAPLFLIFLIETVPLYFEIFFILRIKSLIYITFIPGTFKKFSFNFRPINNL